MNKITKSVRLLIVAIIIFFAASIIVHKIEDSKKNSPGLNKMGMKNASISLEPLTDSGRVYPQDLLFITKEREEYQDGDMTLEIPSIDLVKPIYNGTEQSTLKKGIGLYEMAQPPGEGNENVSIAGHRDLSGMEFYYIDKIQDGDQIFLTYGNRRYVYEYKETLVIEENDWSVIYCKDYPAVTLTSCEPIGVADKRIVVIGELIEIQVL